MRYFLLALLLFPIAAIGATQPSVEQAAAWCAMIVRHKFPGASVDATIASESKTGATRVVIHGELLAPSKRTYEYAARCIFTKKGATIKLEARDEKKVSS